MAVQAQSYPENLGLPTNMSGLQDWIGYNPVYGNGGVDVCSSFQYPQQHEQNLLLSQENFGLESNIGVGSSSSTTTCDSFIAMVLSQSLDVHFRMQRDELDSILQLQNERLRYALQEQRKSQVEALLKSAESKASTLLRQKEEHLAEARRKTLELEARLRKAQMENETWQRVARTNESMVVELNNTLEQVRERVFMVSDRGQSQDAESCGSCAKEQEEDGTTTHKKIFSCKSCNSRRPCVIFLPCRHLCSCKSCEAFLGSCPICKSVKEASMEVFWF
ncbi:hypothetical protein K2173_027915 [Erythroxylum novogranatense]|uniref:RING-type domain-containing protein n=1 Tax=Erythroxylum novogranatense TaxID=1862640 RepID=A0AAV8U0M3_9ROSI|nr:hypothetical protein K2173_027915 [Erythroxylum novogranatense]